MVTQSPFGSGWPRGGYTIQFWTVRLKGNRAAGEGAQEKSSFPRRNTTPSLDAVVGERDVGDIPASLKPHRDKPGDKGQQRRAGR